MNYKVNNIYKKTSDKKVEVSVPGSKSITARALLIAALAEGESTLSGAQFSDDCNTFLKCIQGLGIHTRVCGNDIKIQGCGGRLNIKKAQIDVGSAGTAARFLPAFLAFQEGEFTINCSKQMKSRPIEPLIRALKGLGATFEFSERENCYPFVIRGTLNPAREVEVDVTKSSQFLSAMLISAVCAKGGLRIKTAGSHGLDYVKMTTDMMSAFGVTAKKEGGNYSVEGTYAAQKYDIEPDVSAACYFYAINKILGTNLVVRGVTSRSMQGDIKFIKLIENFDGGRVDMGAFSDQTLTLAAIAPYFNRPTEICGVAHIRGQECDRIAAIVENLTAMGVRCEERADGVKIYPTQPKPAKIKTFGDHRVAMSFAVCGLRADGIEIEEAEVCSKTFKEYFDVLDDVCAQVKL